jgi:hypothetical protein
MVFYDYEQQMTREKLEREFRDMLQMEKDNSTELRQLKLRQYQNRFFLISKYKEVFAQYMPLIGGTMWIDAIESASKFLTDKTIDKRKNTPEKQGMTTLRSMFDVRFGFTNVNIYKITGLCGFGWDAGVTSYKLYFTCEDAPDEKFILSIPVLSNMNPKHLLKPEMTDEEFNRVMSSFALYLSCIDEESDGFISTATLFNFPDEFKEDKELCKIVTGRLGLHRVPIKE